MKMGLLKKQDVLFLLKIFGLEWGIDKSALQDRQSTSTQKNVPFVTTSASENLSTIEYIIYLTFDVKIRIK